MNGHAVGAIIRGTVVRVVSGGLLLDLDGARAFLPASQIGMDWVEDLGQYVGELFTCVVLESDPFRSSLVVSHRRLLEQERDQARQDLFARIQLGDHLPGTVRNVTDFGVFVNLGGIDGLVHISNMSWGFVEHPGDLVQPGEEIEVVVLSKDEQKGQIGLGMKQLHPPPAPAAVPPGDGGEARHLYLDFSKNAGDLRDRLQRLKRQYPYELFPVLREGDDVLEHLVATVFPEGLQQTYYFSNTCLRAGRVDVTIRPKLDGPRLKAEFPRGLAVCVRGHPSPLIGTNPVLVIDRVLDISDSPQREFEVEADVIPYATEERVYGGRARRNNLLAPEFQTQLPLISLVTGKKLEDWRAYLGWKRRLIQTGLAGIRYLRLELGRDGLLSFLAVAPNEEAFQGFQRFLRKEELMAFDLGYSQDQWEFRYREDSRAGATELGDHVSSNAVGGTGIDVSQLPWEAPYTAEVRFRLTEEDQTLFDDHAADQFEAVRDRIVGEYPEQGFLAISSVGDFALIGRQERVMQDLEEQSGYAPFLSSWLFDVSKANPATELVDVDGWATARRNTEQEDAVKSMLAAPDLFLLQGPPGTGKTTVIAEAIYQFVRRGQKVLLVSQAHLAVDNALARLPKVPDVRPVRLGRADKISEDGEPFHRDRVVGRFYESIAASCRQTYLTPWADHERRVEEIREWLRRSNFLYEDWQEMGRRRTQFAERHQAALRARREEEERLQERRRRNAAVQRQREHLEQFRAFLVDRSDGHFVLPESVLDLLWEKVALPLRVLEDARICLNVRWHANNGLTAAERSEFGKAILLRWWDLEALRGSLAADLERLRRLPGDAVLDAATAGELLDVQRRFDEVSQALEEDAARLSEWQDLRRRLGELKKQSSGLNRDLYARFFTLAGDDGAAFSQTLTAPQASKREVIAALSNAVDRLGLVAPQITSGLEQVAQATEEALASLRDEDADEGPIRRMDAEIRQLEQEQRELEGAILRKEDALANQIRTLQEKGLLQTDCTPGRYEELREQLGQAVQHTETILQGQRAFRDKWEVVLRDWVRRLEEPESSRLDQPLFLPTYLEHCNVVGVTCNEHRRTLEDAGHTYFDVAIVDEVSKATPPELLLPMMLARKTILVGDHRQLPPLFKERQGSWEEVLDQQEEDRQERESPSYTELTPENFERYRRMVTASLFKEHFENAHASLKAPLFVQYRMHPDIMDVVNHFYEGKLRCGLDLGDPEQRREHRMTIPSPVKLEFITPERHAVWIDSGRDPFGQLHEEEQAGTSKTNALEALLIVEALDRIDRECRRLGYGKDGRKSVGVISFYGRQVRLLRQLLRARPRFEAIWPEINTVDRFQGKEKPIILVSLVRNKRRGRKTADSHVAQFERVNVAFSRAQELLLVVGAKDMFFDYPVRLPYMSQPGFATRRVYQEIITLLDRKGCFFDSRRLLSQQAYEEGVRKVRGVQMRAGSIKVSFPVLRLESVVRHYTPRRPTAFEDVLIRLQVRFADDPEYRAVALATIFRDILRVPDADILVLPALQNLIALGVLSCSAPDQSSLKNLTLRDVTLTETGRQMHREGVLPAVPVDDLVSHTYDPIRGELVTGTRRELFRQEAGPVSVRVESFAEEYPRSLIEASIPGGGHGWWSLRSKIQDCSRSSVEVLYRTQEVTVELEEDGSVRLEAKDPAYTTYLNNLEGHELIGDLLTPAFRGADAAGWEEALGKADFGQVRTATEVFPASDLPGRIKLGATKVHFLREVPGLVAPPDAPPSRSLIVVFDPDGERLDVRWDADGTGAVVRVPAAFPAPGGVYWDGEGAGLFAGACEVSVRGVPFRLNLGYALRRDFLPPALQGIRVQLEQLLLDSGEEDALPALAHWQPPETAWKKIREAVSKGHQEPEAAITALRKLYRRLEQQRKGRLPAWEDEAAALLRARLDQVTGPLAADSMGAWVSAATAAGVTAARLVGPLAEALLARAETPGTLQALDALLGKVESLGHNLRCPCPRSLYADPVIVELCAAFPADDFSLRLQGRNALEEALARLKVLEVRLKDVLRLPSLLGPLPQAALLSGSLTVVRECCCQWLEEWQALLAVAPGLATLAAETPLARLHASVSQLQESLGRLATVPAGFDRVYVLDPKALLEQPGLLFEFSTKDLIVISTTAEADLEQLRTDERHRQTAGNAARTLQQVRATNVRRDEPDLALVLQDGLDSGDRATFALALKYRAADPVLLTPDAALIERARITGIKATDLSEFRASRQRQTAQQPGRPPQGKKGRKKQ